MKFVCLGLMDEGLWDAMSKSEQDAYLEEFITYDEKLLAAGHYTDGGETLQPSRAAKTLRWSGGKVLVTDGPFAETKVQLGGVAIFTISEMQQAIDVWSKHPCLKVGDMLEIRPVDEEFSALWVQRQAGLAGK